MYDVISKHVNQCRTASVCFYSCRRTTLWSVTCSHAESAADKSNCCSTVIFLSSTSTIIYPSVHKVFSTSKNCNTEPSWVVYANTGHYLDCVQFPAGVRFQPGSRLQRPHSVRDVFIHSYLNLSHRKAFLNIWNTLQLALRTFFVSQAPKSWLTILKDVKDAVAPGFPVTSVLMPILLAPFSSRCFSTTF